MEIVADLLERGVLFPDVPEVREMSAEQAERGLGTGFVAAHEHRRLPAECLVDDAEFAFAGCERGFVLGSRCLPRRTCVRLLCRESDDASTTDFVRTSRTAAAGRGCGERQGDAGGLDAHARGEVGHRDSRGSGRNIELAIEVGRDGHAGRAAKEAAHGVERGEVEPRGSGGFRVASGVLPHRPRGCCARAGRRRRNRGQIFGLAADGGAAGGEPRARERWPARVFSARLRERSG